MCKRTRSWILRIATSLDSTLIRSFTYIESICYSFIATVQAQSKLLLVGHVCGRREWTYCNKISNLVDSIITSLLCTACY